MNRDDEVFGGALTLPEAERAAYLEKACWGDGELRDRVVALLRGHERARNFLTAPLTRLVEATPEEKPSDKIGRYKLLEKIGEGGCGVVWMAEQEVPVRRRVALKVIKLGMDTKAVVARFEAERQALALMDHPNIAKVFDAGTTDTGRPFFVMELVRGIPITRYCDDNNLPTEQRLQLFISVCHAIQHAHQKGIIHRDIKPSNVLVAQHDEIAVAKVIDFGIAKATQGRLTDSTVFTAFEQFIGTPAYMSPEQAEFSGLDVDTRSDVYSLGVLLYELLTGKPPFDPKSMQQAGLDEIRRIIREVEPPRPSTRLSTLALSDRTVLAKLRGTLPTQLTTQISGDLDWIVMKSLEKNRARRYESASAFALDVARHLSNEAVVARPPSTGYLLQKLIRRHRVAFATAAAIGVVLALGATVSTWQAIRATRAERIATAAEQTAVRGEQEQSRLREAAQRAQATESELRTQAEAERLAARRRAYVSDMNVLQQSLAADNLGRAQQLLDRQQPKAGEVDLRGWEWRYLWQYCRNDATSVLTNEPMMEARLAVSADGEWLATAQSSPDTVKLWNLRTRQSTTVPLPENCTWPVIAFVPHEPWLMIGWQVGKDFRNQRGGFRIWNFVTQQVVKEESIFFGPNQITIAEDGKSFVSLHSGSGWANMGRLSTFDRFQRHHYSRSGPHVMTRDLKLAARQVEGGVLTVEDYSENKISNVSGSTPTPIRTKWKSPPAQGRLTSLAFSHDGKLLAAARDNLASTITLFEAETGREIGTMTGHGSYVNAMVFLRDGKTLATGAADQTIRIWDVETRTLRRTLRGHTRPVTDLVLLPNTNTLVSSSGDGTVRFWDTMATRSPAHFQINGKFGARWYFTQDSQSIVANEDANKVVRFHGRQFRERTQLGGPEPLLALCMANEAPLFAGLQFDGKGTGKGMVQIWNYELGEKLREIPAPEEAAVPVAFTEQGKKLLLEYWDKNEALRGLAEWDVTTGKKLRSWPRATTQGLPVVSDDGRQCLIRPTNVIGQYPFSYEGELVIPHDAPCSIIDLTTGVERKIEGMQAGFRPARFSRDGQFFVAPTGTSLSVWDTKTFQVVKTVTANGSVHVPQGALFSPDGGRVVAVASGAEAVRFWDYLSGEQVLSLPVPGAKLADAAFSPDGNWLGAVGRAGGLYLWRAPSWAEIEAAEKSEAKR